VLLTDRIVLVSLLSALSRLERLVYSILYVLIYPRVKSNNKKQLLPFQILYIGPLRYARKGSIKGSRGRGSMNSIDNSIDDNMNDTIGVNSGFKDIYDFCNVI